MDRVGNPSRSFLSRRSWRERRANRSGEGAHLPREEAPAGSARAGNGVKSREPGRGHLSSGSCLLHGREPHEGARSLQPLVHVAKGPCRCCQQSRVIGTRQQISPAESGPLSFSQSPGARAAFQRLRTRSCGSGPRGALHPGPHAPRASPKTLSGWGPRRHPMDGGRVTGRWHGGAWPGPGRSSLPARSSPKASPIPVWKHPSPDTEQKSPLTSPFRVPKYVCVFVGQ